VAFPGAPARGQALPQAHAARVGGPDAVIFIGLQALQVIVAPIPGDVTGLLGGYLFGEWIGFLNSTIGLTLGSVAAFGIGRWLGVRYVRGLVNQGVWEKLGFIVEAEGTILCLMVYLIPGLPKDLICYLFGLSPMPVWVFTLVSTLGRMPGTWVLSTQGPRRPLATTARSSYSRLSSPRWRCRCTTAATG
jgi:uncharacterized membrane protein YdjX (TVP38/TMEM64 family)